MQCCCSENHVFLFPFCLFLSVLLFSFEVDVVMKILNYFGIDMKDQKMEGHIKVVSYYTVCN